MKLYVDTDYYKEVFVSPIKDIAENDIKKNLIKAQQKIDSMTYNRIIKYGFDNLTSFQQEKIKNACCYQANYYYINGTDEDVDISSYSVLDINITLGNSKVSEASYNSMSSSAYNELKQTGLMCGVL